MEGGETLCQSTDLILAARKLVHAYRFRVLGDGLAESGQAVVDQQMKKEKDDTADGNDGDGTIDQHGAIIVGDDLVGPVYRDGNTECTSDITNLIPVLGMATEAVGGGVERGDISQDLALISAADFAELRQVVLAEVTKASFFKGIGPVCRVDWLEAGDPEAAVAGPGGIVGEFSGHHGRITFDQDDALLGLQMRRV